MKHTMYFQEDFWERLEEESKKLGLSKSAYITMTLLTLWNDKENKQ